MGTTFLFSLFFLRVINLWSVDCSNGTSEIPTPVIEVFLDVTNGSTSNRSSIRIPDHVLDFLQSRWLTRFVPSVYTVVFLLSLPLNLMAIFTFLFTIQVKSPAVVFMLNLALADVLFITVLPFDIVYRFSGNNWVIGEGMCRFVTAALYGNMYCSILLMTSISVDRFLVVVYPMQSLSWRTVGRAWLVCLFIWMVSLTATVPLLICKLTVYVGQLNITTCYELLKRTVLRSFYFPYFSTYISIFFFLPFIITAFCYAATIRSLSSPTIESPFKKSHSVLLCVTVLCEFIFCFGPSNVIFLVYYLTFQRPVGDSVYFAYIILVCLSSISCCLDPAIYYFGSAKYKKQTYSLICCCKTEVVQKSSSRTTGGESSGCTL